MSIGSHPEVLPESHQQLMSPGVQVQKTDQYTYIHTWNDAENTDTGVKSLSRRSDQLLTESRRPASPTSIMAPPPPGSKDETLNLKDAFIIVPSGPYPYSGLQIFAYFLEIFFPLVSLVVIGLRIYSRRLAKGFGMGLCSCH